MYLLTGSTGFIGSSLVKRLEHGVRCVVRSRKEEFTSGFEKFDIDSLTTHTNWSGAFDGVTTVIHLAARAHVLRDEAADPLMMFRQVNTAATLHLAREAAIGGVKRFVFLSSIGIYGNQDSQPISERTLPHPAEPYAVSKFEAEAGLRQVAKETGLEVTIIRAPLVYGPNAPGNFGRLADAVLRGVRLPLGAIRNKRSFIALDNLVDFICLCAWHPKAANETFVIADGEDVSTPDLVRRMANAFGKPTRLISVPSFLLRLGATLFGNRSSAEKLLGTLLIDVTKARELLDWCPLITMDEQLSQIAKGLEDGHS
ncbi:MAG: NAD-dependent epimerase/dehydratase family protein [Terracidiphilus sp.]